MFYFVYNITLQLCVVFFKVVHLFVKDIKRTNNWTLMRRTAVRFSLALLLMTCSLGIDCEFVHSLSELWSLVEQETNDLFSTSGVAGF